MLARSFVCGVCLGVFYDLLRLLRIMTATEPKKSYFPRTAPTDERLDKLCDARLPLPPLLRLYGKDSVPSVQTLCKSALGKSHSVICHILRFFSDIFFFAVAGVAISLVLYYNNDGQFRLLVPLIVLSGFFTYCTTFGRIVKRFASLISFALSAAVTYIALVAFFPLMCIYKILGVLIRATVIRVYKRIKLRKLKKDSHKKYSLLISASKYGFLEADLTLKQQ